MSRSDIHINSTDKLSKLINLSPEIRSLIIAGDISSWHFRYIANIKIQCLTLLNVPNIDHGLKYLLANNISKIIIDSSSITNKGLMYLSESDFVTLRDAIKVTDQGLRYLAKIKTLALCNCPKITDRGINYLISLNTITIIQCPNITLRGITTLGIKTIHFDDIHIYCYASNQIHNNNLVYAHTLDTITLPFEFKLNNRGAKYLANVKNIHSMKCSFESNITPRYLTHIEKIFLRYTCWNIREFMNINNANVKIIVPSPSMRLSESICRCLRRAEIEVRYE